MLNSLAAEQALEENKILRESNDKLAARVHRLEIENHRLNKLREAGLGLLEIRCREIKRLNNKCRRRRREVKHLRSRFLEAKHYVEAVAGPVRFDGWDR